MTYGHFEKGVWIVDGSLSDCDLRLTELEYDALTALTILGYAVVSNTLKDVAQFVGDGLKCSFADAKEFINAKDSLAAKIHSQYVAYMDELEFKESRAKELHEHIRWTFKGDGE